MTPDEIKRLFTRSDGQYFCARWGRPLSPVVFGIEDETLAVVKGAFEAVCAMCGHHMAETDPELGANTMVFFFRDWAELPGVPNLDRMVEGLDDLVARLIKADANQYRVFRFDDAGAIRACFVFLRMDSEFLSVPAETVALAQAVQSLVVWSDAAFSEQSPLGQLGDGRIVLRPEIGALMRAVYDPVMPACAQDDTHALRLAARITVAS